MQVHRIGLRCDFDTFLPRRIDVYYDGQVVTSLKGAQQKAQAMVAMKFYIHRIAIHLEGSKHKPHVINRVSATKQAGADSLTKLNPIRIGRNLTLTHVYVVRSRRHLCF